MSKGLFCINIPTFKRMYKCSECGRMKLFTFDSLEICEDGQEGDCFNSKTCERYEPTKLCPRCKQMKMEEISNGS